MRPTATRRRGALAHDERALTIIELLIVLVVIAVLLAILVPSYLGFKQRAERRTAEANVRTAIPALKAFYSEKGTYAGATLTELQSIDKGLASVTVDNLTPTSFHISYTEGACWAEVTGPGGSIASNC